MVGASCLVTLQVFVIAATAVDWSFPLLLQGYGAGAFNGDYFWWTWGVSLVMKCLLVVEDCLRPS